MAKTNRPGAAWLDGWATHIDRAFLPARQAADVLASLGEGVVDFVGRIHGLADVEFVTKDEYRFILAQNAGLFNNESQRLIQNDERD